MALAEVGCSNPASNLNKVVFPQPLGSTTAQNSFEKTSSVTSCRACVSVPFKENDLLKFLILSFAVLSPKLVSIWLRGLTPCQAENRRTRVLEWWFLDTPVLHDSITSSARSYFL